MTALLRARALLSALQENAAAAEAPEMAVKRELPNSIVGKPLYVALKVMPGSAKALQTWMADQGIANPVPPDELHITTVYSRTPVPLYRLDDRPKEVVEQLDPASYELGFLGEEGALVLFVESSQAVASHEYAADLGASWDYPSYRPHVTLSYAPGTSTPAEPPPFAIEVGDEHATALDVSSA